MTFFSDNSVLSKAVALLKYCFIVLSVTLMSGPSWAQLYPASIELETIILPSGDEVDVNVGETAIFMSMGDIALSIDEVIAHQDWRLINNAVIDGTRANPDLRPTAPYATGYPAWIHFRVNNPSPFPKNIIIDTQRPDLRDAQLYAVTSSAKITRLLSHSYKDPFKARNIDQADLAVRLQMEPRQTLDFYMRYVRSASEAMPLKVYSERSYQVKTRNKAVIVSVFLAFMVTVIGMTLFAMPAIGWRITLTWVACVGIVALWFTGVSGYFFHHITPNSPYLGIRAADFFGLLTGAAFINIGRVLFRINEIHKLYDRIALAVIGAVVFTALLMLIWDIYETPWLAYLAVFVNGVAYLFAAINVGLAVYAKRPGAYIILFGGVALVLAHWVYNILTSNSGASVPAWGRYQIVPLVSFIEISCFTAAIVKAQIDVMRQRDEAQKGRFKAVQAQLRLNEALHKSEVSYQKATQQAELRRERLSFMSHDILQPLASLKTVLGSSSAIDDEKQSQMRDAFAYLEALAKENLHMPKGDDDGPEDDFETFSTRAVTDNVYAMFKDEALAKGLEFDHDVEPVDISSHPVELMRILSNLVSNAIKHTPSGHIKLSTHTQNGHVCLTVEDTGPGMSDAQLENFLRPYKKGDRSEGTGLGLYQVKTACETLGHEFRIISTPGMGTQAQVILPRARKQASVSEDSSIYLP